MECCPSSESRSLFISEIAKGFMVGYIALVDGGCKQMSITGRHRLAPVQKGIFRKGVKLMGPKYQL